MRNHRQPDDAPETMGWIFIGIIFLIALAAAVAVLAKAVGL